MIVVVIVVAVNVVVVVAAISCSWGRGPCIRRSEYLIAVVSQELLDVWESPEQRIACVELSAVVLGVVQLFEENPEWATSCGTVVRGQCGGSLHVDRGAV